MMWRGANGEFHATPNASFSRGVRIVVGGHPNRDPDSSQRHPHRAHRTGLPSFSTEIRTMSLASVPLLKAACRRSIQNPERVGASL